MKELIAEGLVNSLNKSFAKGSYIYRRGDSANKIYSVVSGTIKVEIINTLGKRITKAILKENNIFGEMALFGTQNRRDYACVLENAVIQEYEVIEIQNLLKSNPKFQFLLLDKMARQVVDIEQRINSLVFKNSRIRVIEFLIKLGRKEGEPFVVMVQNPNTVLFMNFLLLVISILLLPIPEQHLKQILTLMK